MEEIKTITKEELREFVNYQKENEIILVELEREVADE